MRDGPEKRLQNARKATDGTPLPVIYNHKLGKTKKILERLGTFRKK
jgi:hypothetical protein